MLSQPSLSLFFFQVVSYLCFCGASTSQQDRFGSTPLDDAVRLKRTQVVEFLKEFVTPTTPTSPFRATVDQPRNLSSPAERQPAKPASFPFALTKQHSEELEVPENLRDYIGKQHHFFLAVNTSFNIKTPRSGFRKLLSDCGIAADDPRVSGVSSLPSFFTEEAIVSLAENNSFLRSTLEGHLVIPNFPDFAKKFNDMVAKAKLVTEGEVSKRLPTLAATSPDLFGVAVCTIDGQKHSSGDSKHRFVVANISKVVSYALALEEYGQDVHKFVGSEPSGRDSNDLVLNSDGLPYNPLLDSGGLMCSSLIRPDLNTPDRFEVVVNTWTSLFGGKRPSFNNANFLCEKDFADRNYSLGYLMKAKKIFPPETDVGGVVALYCMFNSIEATAEDLASFAGTLANGGGVCPVTGVRVFKPATVRSVLSLMSSCGMYGYSGEFFFSIGVPAKSSISGAMVIVIPNVMGVCTFSPRLGKYGVSASGLDFSRRFTEHFAFHTYDKMSRANHQDPRLYHSSTELDGIAHLCFSASKGDLNEVRRMLSVGINVNSADYDGRTALHTAVAENQVQAAQFLVLCGADLNRRDNWGNTPLDEVNKCGNKELLKILDKAVKLRAAGSSKVVIN